MLAVILKLLAPKIRARVEILRRPFLKPLQESLPWCAGLLQSVLLPPEQQQPWLLPTGEEFNWAAEVDRLLREDQAAGEGEEESVSAAATAVTSTRDERGRRSSSPPPRVHLNSAKGAGLLEETRTTAGTGNFPTSSRSPISSRSGGAKRETTAGGGVLAAPSGPESERKPPSSAAQEEPEGGKPAAEAPTAAALLFWSPRGELDSQKPAHKNPGRPWQPIRWFRGPRRGTNRQRSFSPGPSLRRPVGRSPSGNRSVLAKTTGPCGPRSEGRPIRPAQGEEDDLFDCRSRTPSPLVAEVGVASVLPRPPKLVATPDAVHGDP